MFMSMITGPTCGWSKWKDIRGCRACLATDVVLFNMYDHKIVEDYVAVCGIDIIDDYPKLLCWYCFDMVKKFNVFRNRCKRAYGFLVKVDTLDKHVTISTLQEIHNANKDFQIPPITVVNVNDNTTSDYPNDNLECTIEGNKSDINSDNDFTNDCNSDDIDTNENHDDDDVDVIESKQNSVKEISKHVNLDKIKTVGDLLDISDHELELMEEKWLNGEYQMRDILKDCFKKISSGDPIPVIEFDDVADDTAEPENVRATYTKTVTNVQLAGLAKKYGFRAKFLTQQEQIDEVELNKKSGLKFVCTECGVILKSESGHQRHLETRHNPGFMSVCDICSARFTRKESLWCHMQQHAVTFCCQSCDHKTKIRSEMKVHQIKHQKKICEFCGKGYQTGDALNKHMNLRHPASRLVCNVCGKSVKNEKGMFVHKNSSHPKFTYSCDRCPAQFYSEAALQRHDAMFCNLINCSICGYVFGNSYFLKLHIILCHQCDTDLSYSCAKCKVGFLTEEGLQKHIDTCMRSVHCIECGEMFEAAGQLTEHTNIHEDKIKETFNCVKCRKYIKGVVNYKNHYDSCKRKCDKASKVCVMADDRDMVEIKDGGTLNKNHSNNKPKMICEACGKIYYNKVSLISHIKIHTGDLLNCQLCPKRFTTNAALKRHERLHTGVKLLSCSKCTKRFVTFSDLHSHAKLRH
ncbi:zinc finger protein 93 [Amyelois transitella]|uniref:zinc finger protein 93 n=1 Tax=Amyelois transitella TaxID=680683 RepID=UPI00298F8084|nr:zinc finger protein 93 [Amyelois transitella]